MDDSVTRYTLDIQIIEPTLVGLEPEDHKARVDAIMAVADRITAVLQSDAALQNLLREQRLQLRPILTQK